MKAKDRRQKGNTIFRHLWWTSLTTLINNDKNKGNGLSFKNGQDKAFAQKIHKRMQISSSISLVLRNIKVKSLVCVKNGKLWRHHVLVKLKMSSHTSLVGI